MNGNPRAERPARAGRSLPVVVAAGIVAISAFGQGADPSRALPRFYPDDPISVDRDDLPIAIPAEVELSTTFDVLENTFAHHPDGTIPRAVNANTLGEVPDSSWFTNRIGIRDMGLDELARGAAVTGPPDASRPLTIVGGKSGGITPGFTLRDGSGRVYFIKFDPIEYRNLATGPDVLVAKFFHAIGYNVPENYVAYLRPEDLVVGDGAQVSIPGKGKRPISPEYVVEILSNAGRTEDGRIRVVASLAVSGEPIGPFLFHGVRGDDPNDIFKHEDRRELRGYRVFYAWLNHDDSRGPNTLDTFIRTDGDQGYVRHHLIDFSSTLGSGSSPQRSIAPQNPRAGNEYVIELGPLLKTAVTFGLWERPWRAVTYDHVPSFSEIGRIESDFYRPEVWKPEYPNPAFDRMLPDDAFWAAKILARLDDEAIRAIVGTGEYESPEGQRYLADTLIARRDKTVRWYFSVVNPLDGFSVVNGALTFRNLGEEFGAGSADAYTVQWHRFDNETSTLEPFGEPLDVTEIDLPAARVPLPAARSEYLVARVRTQGGPEGWGKAVDVFLRATSDGAIVVGVEREI